MTDTALTTIHYVLYIGYSKTICYHIINEWSKEKTVNLL